MSEAITAATMMLARSIHGPGADHEDYDYYRKHVEAAAEAMLPHLVEGLDRALRGYHFLDPAPGENCGTHWWVNWKGRAMTYIEKLIAEAREVSARVVKADEVVFASADLLEDLADALEAAERERSQVKAELRDVFKTDIPSLRERAEAAEAKIAAALDVLALVYDPISESVTDWQRYENRFPVDLWAALHKSKDE